VVSVPKRVLGGALGRFPLLIGSLHGTIEAPKGLHCRRSWRPTGCWSCAEDATRRPLES
jgi:hypothetical protein